MSSTHMGQKTVALLNRYINYFLRGHDLNCLSKIKFEDLVEKEHNLHGKITYD